MTERSSTPSPHRCQNLERGVFSSLTTLSLYKQSTEEKKQLQSASVISSKKPIIPKPKSPLRMRLNTKKNEKSPENHPRSPLKIYNRIKEEENKPDLELIKLQDNIKSLNLQIAREKRMNFKLETEIKELKNSHKIEISALVTNSEKIQKNLQNMMANHNTLLIEKEKLVEDFKKNQEKYEEIKEQFKSIGSILVSALGPFFSNFEEKDSLFSQEKLRIGEKIKDLVSEKLKEIMEKSGIDFTRQLSEIRGWMIINNLPKQTEKIGMKKEKIGIKNEKKDKKELENNKDISEIKFTVEYFNEEPFSLGSTNEFIHNEIISQGKYLEEVSFNTEKKFAVALYDFQGEREEDLTFFTGDIIEIVEECDSGWWIGVLNGKKGTFPYNFVEIISF